MIGLAVDTPQAAANLWTHIGRRLRGAHRAEALTVAAACLCLTGDTVRAGVALDAAFQEAHTNHTPEPQLAGLLCAAIRAGIAPEKIRQALIAATQPPHPARTERHDQARPAPTTRGWPGPLFFFRISALLRRSRAASPAAAVRSPSPFSRSAGPHMVTGRGLVRSTHARAGHRRTE